MKILFLNGNIPNYVTDGLFHGLRSIPGIVVVDTPRVDYMYTDATVEDLKKTGSRGNTLYKLLNEATETAGKRTYWQMEMEQYDYILFTDIYHQCDLFHYIYKSLHPKRRASLCIIDGYDTTSMFPYFNNSFNLKVRPWTYFYKVNTANYFKREHESAPGLFGITADRFPTLNKVLSKMIKMPLKVFPISMAIPEEHIEYVPLKNKSKEFVNYNVDNELVDLLTVKAVSELGKWQPMFENQNDYYTDIKQSKFGITAKREGWDCLRHYEYAAKGAILCFKNLDKKNTYCAPFGLDNTNCITYTNKQDLLNKLKSATITELEDLQNNQYKWVENYTTKKVALRFLDQLAHTTEN
ncbi:MAG: hypothetical protein JWN56_287 [Sphingobacteriales bacterium]|nr:hypothetical protein [Sphingobacteriales bacterium]